MFKKINKMCKSFATGFIIPPVTIVGVLFGVFSGESGLLDVFGNGFGKISLCIVILASIGTIWFFGPLSLIVGFGAACALSGIFMMWCSK